jgi:hypothetical protein
MHMKPRTTILIALSLVWPVALPCWAAAYDSHVTVRLKPPGEPDVNTFATNYAKGTTSDTRLVKEQITATVVDIDKAVRSISFAGPNGWSYSSGGVDPAELDRFRVGDKVEIAWNAYRNVSVE